MFKGKRYKEKIIFKYKDDPMWPSMTFGAILY